MTDQTSMGDNIRSLRLWRGLTLEVVAQRTGHVASWLSRVERGQLILDSRRDLFQLADALSCSIADITGQPYQSTDYGVTPTVHSTVPKVRDALCSNRIGFATTTPTRPLAEAVAEITVVERRLMGDSDYGVIFGLLAPLLDELYAATVRASADREQALAALVRANNVAALTLKSLGYHDLAWIAAMHAEQAAREAEDPLALAFAGWVMSQASTGTGGLLARQRAVQLARAAADDLQGHDDGPAAEVYGLLHLQAALESAVLGEDPGDHLAEAEATAERTGEGNFAQMMFGPTNVRLWEVAIHLESGDPGKAIEVGRRVDLTRIPLKERSAALHIDMGRALTRERETMEATQRLLAAERLSPQWFRNYPMVRSAISDLLTQPHRGGVGRELRGLAFRCGVSPH